MQNEKIYSAKEARKISNGLPDFIMLLARLDEKWNQQL